MQDMTGNNSPQAPVDLTTYTYTSVDLIEPSYDTSEACKAAEVSLESLIGLLLKGTLPPELEFAMQPAVQDALEALLLPNLPTSDSDCAQSCCGGCPGPRRTRSA